MHTPNTPDYNGQTEVANQTDLAQGLFVLELEERLEMAAVTGVPSGSERCDIDR